MVAVIHEASSLRRAINYNENKVKEGVAVCFDAPYYLKEAADLSFDQKLARLKNLADLRERTQVNTLHVSLNFDPSESHSQEKLRSIAFDYMDKIGFGGQPYLLYQHYDAGHPHMHIVTTNIRPDGTPISLHNLGKIQSEKARKELELEYRLVRAEDKFKQSMYELKPADNKAEYGKSQTKRTITSILNTVLADYKFTSLAELNAVLKLYNVAAERGSENSRTYKTGGLVYRILKDDGSPVGTPIKASLIYGKPTLKKLETLYPAKEQQRKPFKKNICNAIDLALLGRGSSGLPLLISELQSSGIDLIERRNKEGILYGITYIDHVNGTVFNGSDLGKSYSANAIAQRYGHDIQQSKQSNQQQRHVSEVGYFNHRTSNPLAHWDSLPADESVQHKGILETLLQSENISENLPYELSAKKKNKKKRKGQRL